MFKVVFVLALILGFLVGCGSPTAKDTIDQYFGLVIKEKKVADADKLIYPDDLQVQKQIKGKLDELNDLNPSQAKTEGDKYNLYDKLRKATKYKIVEEPKEADNKATAKISVFQGDSEEIVPLTLTKKEDKWYIRVDDPPGTLKDGVAQLDRIIMNLKEQKDNPTLAKTDSTSTDTKVDSTGTKTDTKDQTTTSTKKTKKGAKKAVKKTTKKAKGKKKTT
jgi:hypothetical protein